MKNNKVFYTKQQLSKWLSHRFSEINWQPVIEKLPDIVWRAKWNEMSEKFGLPYSATYIRRLDSEGLGPKNFKAEQDEVHHAK